MVLSLLAVAAICDLKRRRVPNILTAGGCAGGILYCTVLDGFHGLFQSIVGIGVPILLLFPAFCIGGLGAGDIKVFSMVGSFCTLNRLLECFAISFLIAGVWALLCIIRQRGGLSRMFRLFKYFWITARGLFLGIRADRYIERQKKENSICMTATIFSGYLVMVCSSHI